MRDTRSLAVMQLSARAPRYVLIGACVVLVALGVRSLVVPVPAPTVVARDRTASVDLAARHVASRAARDLVAGESSEVIADVGRGGVRLITVAVSGPTRANVAVRVRRMSDGRVAVLEPLAVVGSVETDVEAQAVGTELDDPALERVARRAVRNFLRGDHEDVLADLAPRTRVTLPRRPVELRAVDDVSWSTHGRVVAVDVSVDLGGDRVALRYELAVSRVGGRWLISKFHVDPTEVG